MNYGSLTESGYIITVGASYTQGKEVHRGQRFSDLLNIKMGGDEENLKVYNVSQDGFYFPNIVKSFAALIQEFPKSKCIVIEIGRTEFDPKELENALTQREYDEKQTGRYIVHNLSTKKRITMKVKEYLPFLKILSGQIDRASGKNDNDTLPLVYDTVMAEHYNKSLDAALSLIRTEYDGELIICYHPSVSISNEGLAIKYEDTTPTFQSLCEKNGITFVDTSEAFINAYNEDYSVPYGFWNTKMGSGHLSKAGHRVIAEELYRTIEGQEVAQ